MIIARSKGYHPSAVVQYLAHIEVIEHVALLDRQFGILPKRCLPLLIEPALLAG